MDIIIKWDKCDSSWANRKALLVSIVQRFEKFDGNGHRAVDSAEIDRFFGNYLSLFVSRLFKCLLLMLDAEDDIEILVRSLTILLTSGRGWECFENIATKKDIESLRMVLEKHPIRYRIEIESVLFLFENATRFSNKVARLLSECGVVPCLGNLLKTSAAVTIHELVISLVINMSNDSEFIKIRQPLCDCIVELFNLPRISCKRSAIALCSLIIEKGYTALPTVRVKDRPESPPREKTPKGSSRPNSAANPYIQSRPDSGYQFSRPASAQPVIAPPSRSASGKFVKQASARDKGWGEVKPELIIENQVVDEDNELGWLHGVLPQLIRSLCSRCITLRMEACEFVALLLYKQKMFGFLTTILCSLALLTLDEQRCRLFFSNTWEFQFVDETAHFRPKQLRFQYEDRVADGKNSNPKGQGSNRRFFTHVANNVNNMEASVDLPDWSAKYRIEKQGTLKVEDVLQPVFMDLKDDALVVCCEIVSKFFQTSEDHSKNAFVESRVKRRVLVGSRNVQGNTPHQNPSKIVFLTALRESKFHIILLVRILIHLKELAKVAEQTEPEKDTRLSYLQYEYVSCSNLDELKAFVPSKNKALHWVFKAIETLQFLLNSDSVIQNDFLSTMRLYDIDVYFVVSNPLSQAIESNGVKMSRLSSVTDAPSQVDLLQTFFQLRNLSELFGSQTSKGERIIEFINNTYYNDADKAIKLLIANLNMALRKDTNDVLIFDSVLGNEIFNANRQKKRDKELEAIRAKNELLISLAQRDYGKYRCATPSSRALTANSSVRPQDPLTNPSERSPRARSASPVSRRPWSVRMDDASLFGARSSSAGRSPRWTSNFDDLFAPNTGENFQKVSDSEIFLTAVSYYNEQLNKQMGLRPETSRPHTAPVNAHKVSNTSTSPNKEAKFTLSKQKGVVVDCAYRNVLDKVYRGDYTHKINYTPSALTAPQAALFFDMNHFRRDDKNQYKGGFKVPVGSVPQDPSNSVLMMPEQTQLVKDGKDSSFNSVLLQHRVRRFIRAHPVATSEEENLSNNGSVHSAEARPSTVASEGVQVRRTERTSRFSIHRRATYLSGEPLGVVNDDRNQRAQNDSANESPQGSFSSAEAAQKRSFVRFDDSTSPVEVPKTALQKILGLDKSPRSGLVHNLPQFVQRRPAVWMKETHRVDSVSTVEEPPKDNNGNSTSPNKQENWFVRGDKAAMEKQARKSMVSNKNLEEFVPRKPIPVTNVLNNVKPPEFAPSSAQALSKGKTNRRTLARNNPMKIHFTKRAEKQFDDYVYLTRQRGFSENLFTESDSNAN